MRTFTTLVLLAIGLLLAPSESRAAIFVPVAGSQEITLAVPDPQTPIGDPDGVSTEVITTIRRDLDMTGYFAMLDPASFIERGRGVEPGTFDMNDWRVVGAAALAKTRILPPGSSQCPRDRLCVDVFVYYAVDGQKLAGKRFIGGPDEARALAHRAASAILLAITGEEGSFRGYIAAVGNRSGNKEVYVMDFDGSDVRPVTRNGSINLSPAWSPEGGRIAWTSYKRGNPDLYVKDLASGTTRVLSSREGINSSPAFTPDGSRVALTRTENGDADIFVIDARSGDEVSRLTNGGGIDVSPSYSPDGRQIVFASERSGGSQIYIMDASGGSPRRLTRMDGFFTDPVFSPDGSRVAFVGRSGNFDVFTVEVATGAVTRITQDMGDNEDPSWSPDGRYLIFTSTRRGPSQIWLSTANGRHQVPITTSGGWSQPTWSP